MLEVINYDETNELLEEFILSDKKDINVFDEQIFHKTKYVSHDSYPEFFKKYKNYYKLQRKGLINKETPSFAFIKAVDKHMLIPNPLGLIKRKGEENKIILKNQKVGDDYVKALSKGLKYSEHIEELNLSANRLTFYGVNPLINSIKDNKRLLKRLKVLDLSYNRIGDESVKKIINYIQEEDCDLQELNLEGNSLGDNIVIKLCENISKFLCDKITLLNLGKNLISDSTSVHLANLIHYCHALQILILCWNQIKNFGASLIINKLRKHTEMKVFDISWNNIGNNLTTEPTYDDMLNKTGTKLPKFENFEVNEFRTTMTLAFRKHPGAVDKKSKGSKNNNNKKQENKNNKQNNKISKKILLQQPKLISPFAKELGELFKEPHIELVHLDISHNNIGYDDAVHLAQEIKSNHSIIGIHVDGNEMTIDELGFLHPSRKLNKDNDYYANSQIYYQIGKENNLIKSNVDKIRKIRSKNNCWICEGWREVLFEYKPENEVHHMRSYVKLHLNFENWKAYDTINLNGKFFNSRMCPPGEVLYFFSRDKQAMEYYGSHTVDLKESIPYKFDKEYIKEFTNLQMMHAFMGKTGSVDTSVEEEIDEQDNENMISDTKPKETINSKNESNQIYVNRVGKLSVEINNNVIDEYYRKTLKYCEPRPERKFNQFIKPRTPWTYSVSIWAYYDYKYEGEPDDLILEAFEHDFNRCQFIKDAKEESVLFELKKMLRKNYRKILDTYKFLSSYSGSPIWQITQNTLTEFANACPGLFVKNVYGIDDLMIQERAIKANILDKEERVKKKNKNIPDNIIRHQFMKLLVKVADDKYVRTKTMNSLTEAVSYCLENHFLPNMREFESHKWRIERYYNEYVDNFLKAHLPILDAVYKSWAPRKDPGRKRVILIKYYFSTWMILEEFNNLALSIVDKEFPVREIPVTFNISMKLLANEIENDKPFNMLFPEFLEALCRIIDKASPIPPGERPV